MSRRRTFWRAAAAAATLALAAPAGAQLLGVPLPDLPVAGGVVRGVGETVDGVTRLVDRRLDALAQLVRANPRALETDDAGAPVVRGEVLAISPEPQALDAARAAGFDVLRSERLEELDLTLVTLAAPDGLSARRAVRRLRQLDPDGTYDFNHIYSGAGAAAAAAPPAGLPVRVGLVDSGVAAAHPALAGVTMEQRGFAPGGVAPRAHGTAVASLLVGRGGTLLAADVYGTGPTGGSADAVARALGWMARERVGVVNVSLVGPPNATLAAAVDALNARGHLVVAAVGNDGPAAKPLYPAAYREVIAVTGVDARDRLLLEASRCPGLDFAAPGAGFSAASDSGGYQPVRGTSFAAPIVAARLAARLPRPDRAQAAQAVAALAAEAIDLGKRGYDERYGHGLVGREPRATLAEKNRGSRD